jgi:hypothetical protein
MTKSPTGEDSTKGNGEERNGLTRIRGIGATKRRWLELLGICDVRDLARASAVEIESRLRAEGYTVTRSEIAGWIAQAQEFVTDLPSQPAVESPDATVEGSPHLSSQDGESSQVVIESPEDIAEEAPHLSTEEKESYHPTGESVPIKAEGNLSPSVQDGTWKTFASFSIAFQRKQVEGRAEQRTILRHIEAGTVRIWSGSESDSLHDSFASQLQQWIQSQIGKSIQPEPEAEKSHVTTCAIARIIQLALFQPPQTGMPALVDHAGQGFSSFVQSGESFALAITFQLTGLHAADIAKQEIRYSAQVYARHRTTGAIASLGDTEATLLVQERPFYTALLPETTLQQPGMYRLQVLVTFQGATVPPAFFDVPMLQVI